MILIHMPVTDTRLVTTMLSYMATNPNTQIINLPYGEQR
jgi:hypothetical protein